MKKLLLATTGLCLAVSSASAADIAARPYTKAPALVAAPSWTGFYLSGGAGYGQMESDQYATTSGVRGTYEQRLGGRGYFGVVGGGFDYQFAPSWVAGIFGDAQFGDIKGSIINDTLPAFGAAGRLKNETNWAIGARLGYLVTPNVLSYVNAGYSNGRFGGSNLVNNLGAPTTFSTNSFNRDGWFVGGGLEHSLNFFGIGGPGWFVKTEYRLAEYERRDVNILSSGAPTTAGVSVKPYVQTVSTQLVYRFNTGGGILNPAPLYTKAPPAAPVNWNGFYLGGGGGYGLLSATEHQAFNGAPITADVKYGGRGYFGTISGGYDWQFAPAWVAGVFGDAQFGDIQGTLNAPATFVTGQLKNDVNWAIGARLGYVVAPNVLSYVNAGYSNAGFKGGTLNVTSLGGPALTFNSFNRDGWFLGGGVEHGFSFFGFGGPNWFAKTEYRVAEYGRGEVAVFGGAPGNSISTKSYIQTVSTQLIYRFNWGGPVVAKY